MDNQHRQIKGYRELSQVEIDLMNKIKEQGPLINRLIDEIESHVESQRSAALTRFKGDKETFVLPLRDEQIDELARLNAAEPERWASIARTHFQQGLMALTRAVAQPTFF